MMDFIELLSILQLRISNIESWKIWTVYLPVTAQDYF